MLIDDLDSLRRDMLTKIVEIREEARRLECDKPDDARSLSRIADRLELYVREYLD